MSDVHHELSNESGVGSDDVHREVVVLMTPASTVAQPETHDPVRWIVGHIRVDGVSVPVPDRVGAVDVIHYRDFLLFLSSIRRLNNPANTSYALFVADARESSVGLVFTHSRHN